jgi:3-hydroxy acid dehydrogenase/malonic semialdehyde reductase
MTAMDDQPPPARWCAVTGASRGIGRAVAQGLLAGGFSVVGIARNAALLAELERDWPRRFIALPHDVARPGLHAAFDQLAERGRLRLNDVELAVHCAGCAFQGAPLTAMSDAELHATIDTNVLGTTLVVRDLARLLLQRGSGTLVVLGSIAGHDAAPLMAAYAASKAYTQQLLRCVRADLHGSGVRVSCVQPGTTRTGLLDGQPGLDAAARFEGFAPLEAHDLARTIEWIHQQPAHVNVQEISLFPVAQSLYVRGIHRHPAQAGRPPAPGR